MSDTLEYYSATRPEVANFLPPPSESSRILEIGCGVGNFRNNITHQCEYWGIEPFPDAAAIASTRLDKVLVGTVEEVFDSIPNDYFDCVVCADVIEHMDDPDWFFQSIKVKMKKHSFIIASIPNVRYVTNLYKLFFEKDWEYVQAGTLDKTHLRFFTEKSLKRTIKMNGYLIDEFRGINAIEVSARTFMYLVFTLLTKVICPLIGRDTKFFQFGFRIIPQEIKNNTD